MNYLKKFNEVNEDHYVPENIVRQYESKIFQETGPSMIGIDLSSLKEYLEKYFSVTFQYNEDIHLQEPEKDRFFVEMELTALGMNGMISSETWKKLGEEFSEFEYVEDTSEDTNKNRFIIDLREGIEYSIKMISTTKETVKENTIEEQPHVIEADHDTINSFAHWVDANDGIIGKDQIVDKYGEYMKYVSRLNKAKVSYRQLTPSDISAIIRELEKRGMLAESVLNEAEERNVILSREERSLILDLLNAKSRIMAKGTSRYSPGSGLGNRLVTIENLRKKLFN